MFEIFKNRGLVSLSHKNTEHLLDLLEDAQATLALMLTSRHIGPLRDEAATWAIKLKEISEVLEQVSCHDRFLVLGPVVRISNPELTRFLLSISWRIKCHFGIKTY